MAIWGAIATRIKEIVNKMIGKKTIEQELHVVPAISNKMMAAIDEWTDLYEGRAPWLHEPTEYDPLSVRSLGLPQFIASEKARIALLEFKSEITTSTKEAKQVTPNYLNPNNVGVDGTPEPITATHVVAEEVPKTSTDRADYLNLQYTKLKDDLQTQIEYGIAKGGLVIKPYIVKHDTKEVLQEVNALSDTITSGEAPKSEYEICFDYIQANEFFPLSFDGSGKMTEAAFIERKVDKDIVYTRLEYHKLEDTTVTVINKAYKSHTTAYNSTDLGQQVPLSTVPEWAALQEETKVEGVNRLMFAYFKMPEANTIDSHSPLGVSGFDKAKNLIKDADEQYSRMLWEFEGGELAIDIDRQALRFLEDPTDPNHGHSVMSRGQQRLYRKVDLNEENTYNVFSPELRDASLINGLNTILTKIEDVCGLSRGSVSNVVTQQAKTATELKIIKQRSYQTNARIQKAIQKALKDTIYVMNAYCDLYDITKSGEYEVSFEWDDSIITDSEIELNKRILLIQNGIDSKLETRMWIHGETKAQAVAALKLVQQENIQAVEDNIANMELMGEPSSKKKESPKEENEDSNFRSGDNQYSEAD
jgi:Phage portal protein, SPP1 Gp6-like.